MRAKLKKSLLKTGLAALALTATLGTILLAQGARTAIICQGVQEGLVTSFICDFIVTRDDFQTDEFGSVVSLRGEGRSFEGISASHRSVEAGRGGIRFQNGVTEVLDGVGRVTHRNFSPLDPGSLDSEAANLTILGDAGESPVSLNLTAPIEGVSSGNALFIGQADQLDITVDGRTGLDGLGPEQAAAMQVFRGELGSGDQIETLASSVGLGPSPTIPGISRQDLGVSVGTCEDLPGGRYLSPELSEDESDWLATIERASNMVVSRSACERQTIEEFSVETICARPAEIKRTLTCSYPNLVRKTPVWRRPAETQLVGLACAESVPPGSWELTCSREQFAAVASVVRPEYITLRPSETLEVGHRRDLISHFKPLASLDGSARFDDSCSTKSRYHDGSSAGFYERFISGDVGEGVFLNTRFSRFVEDGGGDQSSRVAKGDALYESLKCGTSSFDKMDELRLSGAIADRYQRNAMPGSEAEWAEGDALDITKLSYWEKRSSATEAAKELETVDAPAEAPFEHISDRSSRFIDWDPDAVPSDLSDEESGQARADRLRFYGELEKLGFVSPSIENAVIDYDKITVKRDFTSDSERSIGDILCRLGGIDPEDEGCSSFSSKFSTPSSGNAASLKFREYISYRFSELRSGVALLRRGKVEASYIEPDSVYRAVTKDETTFQTRAIYIPGAAEISPVTKVSYCQNIKINPSNSVLKTKEAHDFIGPETSSGKTARVFHINKGAAVEPGQGASEGTLDSLAINQSPESGPWGVSKDILESSAATMELHPLDTSFMRIKKINLKDQQLSSWCSGGGSAGIDNPAGAIAIEHEPDHIDRSMLARFKNAQGMLITARGNEIRVYFSPIKTPYKKERIDVAQSLSPGLYAPRVHQGAMKLEGTDIPDGTGDSLGRTSHENCADAPNCRQNESIEHSQTAEMVAEGLPENQLSAGANGSGLEYWAIGRVLSASSSSPYNDYPKRGFIGSDLMHLGRGGASGSERAAREAAVLGQAGVGKRWIRTLRLLSFVGDSENTRKRKNVKRYGSGSRPVLLTNDIGYADEPAQYCLKPSLADEILYPSQLISGEDPPVAEDKVTCSVTKQEDLSIDGSSAIERDIRVEGACDQNEPKVMKDLNFDPRIGGNAQPTDNTYFSDYFIPSSMDSKKDSARDQITIVEDGSLQNKPYPNESFSEAEKKGGGYLDEPVNLAQDYNSFLAQLHLNTSINQSSGSIQYQNSKKSYDEKHSRQAIVDRLSLVGRRGVLYEKHDSGSTHWANVGALKVNEIVSSCFENTPSEYCSGQKLPSHWTVYNQDIVAVGNSFGAVAAKNQSTNSQLLFQCVESIESALGDGGTIASLDGIGTLDFGVRLDYCEAPTSDFYVQQTSGSWFGGVRPYEHFWRPTEAGSLYERMESSDNLKKFNHHRECGRYAASSEHYACEQYHEELRAVDPNYGCTWNWDEQKFEKCHTNYNFHAGLFFPFVRTKAWIWASGRQQADGEGGSYMNFGGAQPSPPEDRSLDGAGVLIPAPGGSEVGVLGGANEQGGARFNPTSFHLPPIGVSAALQFSRFPVALNKNSLTRTNLNPDSIFLHDLDRGRIEQYHVIEASFGAWHGMIDLDLDKWISYASEPPLDDGGHARSRIDREFAQEHDLKWIGMSGYAFSGCESNLERVYGQSSQAHNLELPSNFDGGVGSGAIGYLPYGITETESGGLYFGPLIGSDLTPLSSRAHWDELNTAENNILMLGLFSDQPPLDVRENEQVPVYADGHALTITSIQYGGNKEIDGRQITLGRAISENIAHLEPANESEPIFSYEQELSLVPELLAFFFLHSDVGSGEYGTAASNNGKPYYFDEIFGGVLSPRQKIEIASAQGFSRGLFVATSTGLARPMLFSFGRVEDHHPEARGKAEDLGYIDSPAPIRFAWSFDRHSLHMSVISMNAEPADAAETVSSLSSEFQELSGLIQAESARGVQGIFSGVALDFGSSGIFGGLYGPSNTISLTNETDGGLTDHERAEGLSSSIVRSRPLKLEAVGSGLSGVSTGVFFGVDVTNPSQEARAWYFSENICGEAGRSDFLLSDAADLPDPQNPGQRFDPFKKYCVASALSGQTKAEIDLDEPEENVYWKIIKRELRTVYNSAEQFPGSVDLDNASSPPSCPVGVEKAKVFVTELGVQPTVYRADNGWARPAAAPNAFGLVDPEAPACPQGSREVGRVSVELFSDANLCYDKNSGRSVVDGRADKSSSLCDGGSEIGVFVPTTITATPSKFAPAGVTTSSNFTQPTGPGKDEYSIFSGTITREGDSVSIDQLYPAAQSSLYNPSESVDGWVSASDNPESSCLDGHLCTPCLVIPFDPFNGTYEPGATSSANLLYPSSHFIETERRYGELDPFYVKTAKKQVSLSTEVDGEQAGISQVADDCSWASAPAQTNTGVRKIGSRVAPGDQAQSYQVYTQVLGYNYESAVSRGLTTRQFSPWSSERLDGNFIDPPSCDIFNEPDSIAREKSYAILPNSEGEFVIGQGARESVFRASPAGSADSSLNLSPARFVTGGRWVQVGIETEALTVANSTVPVQCRISVDGDETVCDGDVGITFETVEGFQLMLKADSGEHGGHGGSVVALTTRRPSSWNISARGGKGGKAGQMLDEVDVARRFTCYEKGPDPLDPWIKVYRFNKSVVGMAPGNDGNDGQDGERQFFGWGVHPDAIEFLQEAIRPALD